MWVFFSGYFCVDMIDDAFEGDADDGIGEMTAECLVLCVAEGDMEV